MSEKVAGSTFKHAIRVWNVKTDKGKFKIATVEQRDRVPSMCEGCPAPCCQGDLWPVLNTEEFLNRKFPINYSPVPDWLQGYVPEDTQYLAVLDVPDNGCRYFDMATRNCTIWPNCPESCKAYDCREDTREGIKQFAEMRKKIWQARSQQT